MVSHVNHEADVQRYMDGVLSGEIIAGRLVRYAVERHQRDLTEGPARGLRFDPDAANDAINYFPVLRHTTGEYAGEPFVPRLWQKFILWSLFGWRRADDMRRFRYAYISVARGNGKSPFSAAIGNLLFTADVPIEPRAQVYAFATKEKQARDIVFGEAKKQIEGSPGLQDLVTVLRSNMSILSPPHNGSVFEPQGSDSKKSDGWIIHGAVIDELHAWEERHRGLFDKIETAMSKRRQPLCVIITTAGDDRSEIWQEQYDFYVSIVTPENNIESDAHFAFIAEIDKDEECGACEGEGCDSCGGAGRWDIDVLDERYWPQANPMLNEPSSPVKIDGLRTLAAKAKLLPTDLNKFRRYHANQQVASFYKVISAELWAKGNVPLTDLEGRRCFGGFDWGWRNDLAGLTLVFPLHQDGKVIYEVKAWAWIPEGCERDLNREPWATWIRRGCLTVTDGDMTDTETIYGTMQEVVGTYQLSQLAYDPNNAREFASKCVNEWGIETYDFFQSCKRYNEPTRELLKALKERRVHHGGNPLLAWCAGNMCVKEDSNEYIMPSKPKSSEKIDPMVALVMAVDCAMFAEPPKPKSIYSTAGNLTL